MPKVNRLCKLVLNEVSMVDRGANQHAHITLFKRDFSDRQHLADTGAAMPDGSFPIRNVEDLKNAIHAIGRAKDEAAAKKHIISRAKALGKTELLPEGWVSKSAGNGNNPAHDGEIDMDEKELQKKIDEALTAKTADLTKKLDEVTKAKDAAEAIAKMSDAEKAHMAALSKDDAAKFLAMSKEDRAKEMKKRDDADPEVYKAADGTVFKKSDDPRLVSFAKKADEAEKIAKAEREARETAEFTKRAETELAHLPGTPAEKAALLKALASTDESVKKTAEAILRAGEGAIKGAFDKIGVAKGDVEGSPEAKLNTLAKAKAEKENISFAKAYTAVLDTEEGQRLYAESRQAAA